jgi:hypothetical protein
MVPWVAAGGRLCVVSPVQPQRLRRGCPGSMRMEHDTLVAAGAEVLVVVLEVEV